MKWIRITLAFSVVIALLYLSFKILAVKPAKPLLIGFARTDITPQLGVFLPGKPYNKISNGFHSKLFATSLVIDSGKEKISLVSLDAFGLFRVDVDKIRDRVKDIFPDASHIIVASTHTHSAPELLGIYSDARISEVQRHYLDFLINQCSKIIREADRNKRLSRINVSMNYVNGLIRNDRYPEFIDSRALVMKIYDSDKTGLRLWPAHSDQESILFLNFACHPEYLRRSNLISSDFVGYLRDHFETGNTRNIIFFNGALGGMVVPDTPKKGNVFFDMAVFSNALFKRLDTPSYRSKFLPIHPEFIKVNTEVFKTQLDNKLFKEKVRQGMVPQELYSNKLDVELSLIEVGKEVILVSIPGELSPEISMKIRKLFPSKFVGILGLANDELGYILPGHRYKEKIYEYERSLAVNEQIGDQILEAVKRLARGRGR